MKPYVVGIDIGGTNTVFGIVDARGNVIASSSIKTGKHPEVKDYIAELKTALDTLLENNDAVDKIAGIGVGSGIVVNGQLVYGHDGFAGELGHVTVKPNNGRICGCGRTGCLEAYCSATGVARTAREFLEIRTDPSRLREIPVEDITSKDVYDAAMLGDKIAKEIFEYTGEIMGRAFCNFVCFSSPEAIVLFGGLARSGDLLMKPIKEAMDRYMLNIFKGKTKLLLSELKEGDAAILGASALGWEAR